MMIGYTRSDMRIYGCRQSEERCGLGEKEERGAQALVTVKLYVETDGELANWRLLSVCLGLMIR